MKLTEEEFCKMVQGFDGEPCSSIKQIALYKFNGEDLKEFVEHCMSFNNKYQSVSNKLLPRSFDTWVEECDNYGALDPDILYFIWESFFKPRGIFPSKENENQL
jgi:hypothetical protein